MKVSAIIQALEDGTALIYDGKIYRDFKDLHSWTFKDLVATAYQWHISRVVLTFREAMEVMLRGDIAEYRCDGASIQWRISTNHKGLFKRRKIVNNIAGGWTAATFASEELQYTWFAGIDDSASPKKLSYATFQQILNKSSNDGWEFLKKEYQELVE